MLLLLCLFDYLFFFPVPIHFFIASCFSFLRFFMVCLSAPHISALGKNLQPANNTTAIHQRHRYTSQRHGGPTTPKSAELAHNIMVHSREEERKRVTDVKSVGTHSMAERIRVYSSRSVLRRLGTRNRGN